MAHKVDDLPLYRKAVAFCASITEILARPALRRDRTLHQQISEAADSITANLEEGFEQPTDKAFANYVFIAKGSLGEVLGRLRTARRKNYISETEGADRQREGDDLGRMMGGFIRYLHESDFRDRGRFRLRQPKPDAVTPSKPESASDDSAANEEDSG